MQWIDVEQSVPYEFEPGVTTSDTHEDAHTLEASQTSLPARTASDHGDAPTAVPFHGHQEATACEVAAVKRSSACCTSCSLNVPRSVQDFFHPELIGCQPDCRCLTDMFAEMRSIARIAVRDKRR